MPELGQFKMSNRYQMTFHMGSGDPGAAVADILTAQGQRLRRDPTKTLRIALRLLAKTKSNDRRLIEAVNQEPE